MYPPPSVFSSNVSAASIVASGDCGDNGSNVTWSLDSDGVLTISGSGKMADYKDSSNVPWCSNKDSIKSAIIENGVTSIGNYAFTNCRSLTSISISDSVTSIGNYAFCNCDSLTSVTIPDSVSSFIHVPFYNCSALTDIHVDSNNTKYKDIDGVLFSKDGSELIEYPEGKRNITYIIPDSVSSIRYSAFHKSNLTSITISSSVSSIGNQAFFFSENLKELIFLSKTIDFLGSFIFTGCPKGLVFKGYSGSTIQAYAEENNHLFVDIENMPTSTAYTTITALPASGIITATADMIKITNAQIICVEVPADGEMMDFTLDPNKVLSKVLPADEVKVDPTAMLLFNNRDTDGNLIGMSGKSDPIRFTNKGRMPVNAALTIKPESTFNETDSGLNLVEKISDFDGEKANIYLAAGLPECESLSIGTSGGAVINALIPDSRKNFTLERTDELEFEYIENEDSDNWNALEIYLTGDLDILYPHWNDSSIVTPSKFSNAKYTAVWSLKTVPVSADVLNTSVKSVTLPLKGAKTSAKKIYVKPLDCSLSNQLSAVPEPELLDVSEMKDFLKINTDEIVLKTAFAEYCKSKWGQGSVLVYAPDSQGAIVKIV